MALRPDDGQRFGPDVIAPRPKATRSVGALLGDLATETLLLIRQEIALFKLELGQALGRFVQGAGMLAVGAFVALSGWLFLLVAAMLGLALVVAPWLAALIVGLVALGIGGGLVLIGRKRLAAGGLVPRRTLESLREDEAWLRRKVP
jgi:hypothetical protein